MEKLREYETFDNKEELNEFCGEVLSKFELNETQRDAFIMICKHSVRFKGVSFLKVQTMATELCVSYKTIQRALKALCDLSIIKRIKQMRRVSGGLGASLTILCRDVLSYREDEGKPCPKYNLDPVEKTETNYSKTKNKYIKNNVMDDPSYLHGTNVDDWFIRLTSPFFDNKTIEKLWNRVKICFKK